MTELVNDRIKASQYNFEYEFKYFQTNFTVVLFMFEVIIKLNRETG